jgi:hypothetical protein
MRSTHRRFAAALALLGSLALPGCFTIQHTVGEGPKSVPVRVATRTRWFAFFGLYPMDDLDSKALSGGAHDYRVTTEFTFEDIVMSAITSFATFYRQTVIVEK